MTWCHSAAVLFHAVIFGLAVPVFLLVLTCLLEQRLGVGRTVWEPFNRLVGAALGVPGLVLLAWCLTRQWLGLVPPPQEKDAHPWSRPLMLAGMLLYYVGIAAWLGSQAMVILVVGFGCVLVSYAVIVQRVRRSERELTRHVTVNRDLRRFYHQKARRRTEEPESEGADDVDRQQDDAPGAETE